MSQELNTNKSVYSNMMGHLKTYWFWVSVQCIYFSAWDGNVFQRGMVMFFHVAKILWFTSAYSKLEVSLQFIGTLWFFSSFLYSKLIIQRKINQIQSHAVVPGWMRCLFLYLWQCPENELWAEWIRVKQDCVNPVILILSPPSCFAWKTAYLL